MKETKRVLELARPITYVHGAENRSITVSRIELNTPKAKKLRRLGAPNASFDYFLRVVSLMSGIRVGVLEEMDICDLQPILQTAYEMLRDAPWQPNGFRSLLPEPSVLRRIAAGESVELD